MRIFLIFSMCALLATGLRAAAPGKEGKEGHAAEIDAFFGTPALRRIEVTVPKAEMGHLRDDPRVYAEGTLTVDGKKHEKVALKLKGSQGSFKKVDEKPGLTLNFDKLKGGERLHGQKKMHLNNGTEDPSYLREWLAGEIGRAAGMAAGRCTHALVSINGKDKGLYVVREGFTKDFLAARFGDAKGALFEGHFCKEIDMELELDSGEEEAARAALKELVEACREPDQDKRWERLGKILDLEKYATYLAFEQVMDFSDGYDFNLNNYRLYLVKGKFQFVLHGMDEVLKDANVSLQRGPRSHLGQIFLGHPQGRALYRQKVTELYEKVFRGRDWSAAIAERAEFLKTALSAAGWKGVKEFMENAAALRANVETRLRTMEEQLKEWPEPLSFDAQGIARLTKGWRVENESGDAAKLDEDGEWLRITAKAESTASWRLPIVLEPGRYRFAAKARARGVQAMEDEKGQGAGLRISGAKDKRKNALTGNSEPRELQYEFEIEDGREVILVAELRAKGGEAGFLRESMRIQRLK